MKRAWRVGRALTPTCRQKYIPLGHVEGEQLDREDALSRLRPLLADASIAKRHNTKFHIEVLRDVPTVCDDQIVSLGVGETAHLARHATDLTELFAGRQIPQTDAADRVI
jgi:hypothetical protein